MWSRRPGRLERSKRTPGGGTLHQQLGAWPAVGYRPRVVAGGTDVHVGERGHRERGQRSGIPKVEHQRQTISDAELAGLPLTAPDFHGDWYYRLYAHPNQR
jgi:hypothetical protein